MCRSIKQLRQSDGPPSEVDIQAAALQFVRKVSGYRRPSRANQAAFDRAVAEVAVATERLLAQLNTPPSLGSTMSHFDVIGLGVSTLDILSLVDHLPTEEVLPALAMSIQGGGPVATAIVALARLGARTAMLDTIGDDWRGGLIRTEFETEGVDTGNLLIRHGYSSASACILVRQQNSSRSIVFSPGTAPELSPGDISRSLITSARILHVNGRHWQACLHAVQVAREKNVWVSFDGGAQRFRPEMAQLVPLSDICIIARDFAEKYTGQTDLVKAGELPLGSGPWLVVITEGVIGSWVFSTKRELFHQPAYLLPGSVDTTGCGDSFHGAFLFGILKGFGLEETAKLASAVAALNSQQLGGRSGLPTLEQVETFLSR